MEFLHEELIKSITERYSGFELDRIIELAKLEAMLRIAAAVDNAFSTTANDTSNSY